MERGLQQWAKMNSRMNLGTLSATVACAVLLVSCKAKDKAGQERIETDPGQSVSAGKATAATASAGTEPAKKVELKDNGEEWIPQEHELGMNKFKDPGVYVDGELLGILSFGELPVPLKVSWFEEEASIPYKKGDPGPGFKIVRQRRYSFSDYLTAMGVNLKKIKEVHLYGGSKRAIAVVISGAKLREHPDFAFRFGSDVFGKPIPACPEDPEFADGNCPDNIRAVVIYIDKKTPTRDGGYFYFGDEKVDGIPYFGRPLRGGVRIYKDGRFAAHLKRHKLEEESDSFKVTLPDGSVRYKLAGFLESQGVKTGEVAEAWLVHKDRYVKRLDAKELSEVLFSADSRGSGKVLLGPDRLQTNAIALFTKPLNPKLIPVPEPFELHDDRKQ